MLLGHKTTTNKETIFQVPLFVTALWDLPNSRPVHSLVLSSHLFLCPLSLSPFSLCLARWFWRDPMKQENMTIPLQFAYYRSLYDCLCAVQFPAGPTVKYGQLGNDINCSSGNDINCSIINYKPFKLAHYLNLAKHRKV